MAPKTTFGRYLFVVMALVAMASSQIATAQGFAEFETEKKSYNDEYGRGGSYYHQGAVGYGDFGGFLFPKDDGGSGELFSYDISAGKKINLGCGSVSMFEFMKADFNVGDIMKEATEALKSMVAKYVLTTLMSAMPQLASALDFLNASLKDRFRLFKESCNIGQIASDAKNAYLKKCQEENAGDINKIKECQNWGDPFTPMKKAVTEQLEKLTQVTCGDPIGMAQNDLCNSKESGVGQGGCVLMSFIPRICNSKCCTGPKYTAPALAMKGLSHMMTAFTESTLSKGETVFSQIRAANPTMEPATLRLIGRMAGACVAKKYKEAVETEKTVSMHSTESKNQLAFMDVKLIQQYYGADTLASDPSKVLLDEFRKAHLSKSCPKILREDALFVMDCIVEAAKAELGEQKFDTSGIQPLSRQKENMDPKVFFSIPSGSEDALKGKGFDLESAAIMAQESFSCTANGAGDGLGTVNVTNPDALVELYLSNNPDLREAYKSVAGRDVSCAAIPLVLDFVMKKIEGWLSKDCKDVRDMGDNMTVGKKDGSSEKVDLKNVPCSQLVNTRQALTEALVDFKAQRDKLKETCANNKWTAPRIMEEIRREGQQSLNNAFIGN